MTEKRETTLAERRRQPVSAVPDPGRNSQVLSGIEQPGVNLRNTPPADFTGADPAKDWSQPK